jgi:diguanylate cyclase (GGDEF)-like protein
MSLRIKTLGIIAATLAVLAVSVYVASAQIVLERFRSLEHDQATENVQRARGAIDTEIARINSAGGDWSAWDDTYQFVQDGNAAYIEENLSVDSLVTLRVNMMLFFDQGGGLVFARGVDLEQESEAPVSGQVIESISSVPGILRFRGTSDFSAGLVKTPEGALLLSAWPVVTNDNQGPITGSFIIARNLDEALLEELTTLTQLNLSSFPVDSSDSTSDRIEPINSDILSASTVLTDVAGDPALGLQVEMPRDVYQEGQDTIRYLLYVLLAIGLAFGLLVVIMLESVVVNPVRRLSSFVLSVGGSLSRRAPEMGRDEIGRLGHSVNEMLESIEVSSKALEQANRELRQERAQVEQLNRSLEQKVEERTNDLKVANDELRERHHQLIKARVRAATDALTGLANHRSFYDRIHDLALVGRPVAVLMIDIDGFKQINDQHGHPAGDQMLVVVAEVLREAVGSERVFRYGGDEFAVLAEVDSLEEARLLGERLRNGVAKRLEESGLTVSVGASVYPSAAASTEEAVYQADSAMYFAKSAGKNAVRIWHAAHTSAAAGQR